MSSPLGTDLTTTISSTLVLTTTDVNRSESLPIEGHSSSSAILKTFHGE
jgi:hypothetical protein